MAAELKIGIGADNSGLKQGLQDAEAQISAFVSKVGKIGQIGEQLSSIGQKMSVGLTLPIVALGGAAIKAYGEFQKLEMGLAATMKSAGLAKQEMQELEEVAKLPGLGMKEAVKGSIRLQAIGISADKARNIMQQFGNATAAAGGGLPEFERAIYGVQQLANTDFPLGEDLNIIKDALPQVAGLLDDAFGTANTEKIRQSGVTSKEVLDVILKGLGELPRVKTGIAGAFENLSDTIAKNLNKVGEVIDKTFNISGIIEKVSDSLNSLVKWFENLSPAVQKTILVVTGLVAAAGPLLVVVGGFISALPTILTGLGALKIAFTALTGPIGLVTVGIGAIIAAVVANWGKIKPHIDNAVKWFNRLYEEGVGVRIIVETIGYTFKTAFTLVGSVLKSAWEVFKSFGRNIIKLFSGIGDVIEGVFTLDAKKIALGVGNATNAMGGMIAESFGNVAIVGIDTFRKLDAEAEKAVNNMLGKTKRVFSIPAISNSDALKDGVEKKTNNAITKGVDDGVKKAKDNVKAKPIEIDLPIALNSKLANFTDGNGGFFADLVGVNQSLTKKHNEIWNSFAPPPTFKTDLELAKAEASAFADSINESFNSIVMNSAVNGIQDLFGSIGKAIGEGGNIMSAIAQSLLQTFGGFLSEMGDMLIKYGLLAVTKGELDLAIASGGLVSIGAGIAAMAIGGLLKIAGSALGSRAQKGFGNGGSVGTYSGADSYSNPRSSYSSSSSGGFSGGTVV